MVKEAGAHFSAVAEGRKPLYHDQWGLEQNSDTARPLWGNKLPGVEVVLDSEGHLYAFNRAAVQAIINRAPEQYPGVDLIDKIQRATREGRNGELLGYGARTMLEPGNVMVDIVDTAGNRVFSFLSQPENAAASGAARAEDFARYFQRPFRAVPRAQ